MAEPRARFPGRSSSPRANAAWYATCCSDRAFVRDTRAERNDARERSDDRFAQTPDSVPLRPARGPRRAPGDGPPARELRPATPRGRPDHLPRAIEAAVG